jgi:hypothetical protein
MDNFLGKLLGITREIYLLRPPKYERMDVFKCRDGSSGESRQMTWWLTHQAVVEIRNLAYMAKETDPELANGNVAEIHLQIEAVLKDNLLSGLFDLSRVTSQSSSLFDVIAGNDKRRFSCQLWDKIRAAFGKLHSTWLVIYPLRGVVSQSVDVGLDGLSVMSQDDVKFWDGYSARYPSTTHFVPANGSPERVSAPTVWGFTDPTASEPRRFSWLLCEASGPQYEVVRIAAGRMRTFVALLFCQWHPRHGDFFVIKSPLPEYQCSFQFAPIGHSQQDSIRPGRIGRLMPSLPVDLTISNEEVAKVRGWYAAYSTEEITRQRRAITASHFIHHAVMADGIEKFIHFYIALDALFGERHKVEQTIKEGLLRTFPADPLWAYRADRLFELRNELVHGGASSLDKCNGFDAYIRHTKTRPLEDVALAAMTALKDYFTAQP